MKNTLMIEGTEYSLEKSSSVLHHFNTPMVQFQGNTYYGLAVIAKSEKPEQSNGWISVKDLLPKEGGRYWCYVEEVNDLGVSHFQWNCAYNEDDKSFAAIYLKGGKVTHWMPLPAAPKKEPAPEKNYEILEGAHPSMEVHKWYNVGDKEISCSALGCAIHSVKRLSDGEVFKLGQIIQTDNGKIEEITGFVLIGNVLYASGNTFRRDISNIKPEPTRVPLFKTEDGVELFDGDNCWQVSIVNNYGIQKTRVRPELFPAPSYFKYFSQEHFAVHYAAENARLLSLKELGQFIPGAKEYKEMLALVKNKLTGPSLQ